MAELSDFEDNLLSNNREDADESGRVGYGSDEAIEDTNFRDDDADGTGDSKKRRIDPTTSQKRSVRNPQPKLNTERLKGPRGIHTIEKHFEDFKFRGKGYEKSDLNRMMKRLEYWCHRLFPKLEFDDCLAKLETLGTKKPVQTHLTKIRLGILPDDIVVTSNADGEDEEVVQESAEPIDEFDALIAQELEKKKATVTPQRENVFSPSTSLNASPSVAGKDNSAKIPSRSADIEITPEMRERMEKNRQLAIQKRLARIDAEEARKKALKEQDNENDSATQINEEEKEQTQPDGSIGNDSINESVAISLD